MSNIHVGDASIRPESWPGLFKGTHGSYSLDTFSRLESVAKCIMFPFLPTAFSMSLRFSKNLFPGSNSKLIRDHMEWRVGVLLGAKTESSSWFTSRDYNQPPPAATFTYQELRFNYRRSWVDFSNQFVYRVRGLLFRRNIRHYLGAGIGLTVDANSRITEDFVQYKATYAGSGYLITEDNHTSSDEKAKTVASSYLNLVWGTELVCSKAFSLLFEANYQGYMNSFSQKTPLYKSGGYLSFILRYKF